MARMLIFVRRRQGGARWEYRGRSVRATCARDAIERARFVLALLRLLFPDCRWSVRVRVRHAGRWRVWRAF